jgi:hypothetical protein
MRTIALYIPNDPDLQPLHKEPKFAELVAYAQKIAARPR